MGNYFLKDEGPYIKDIDALFQLGSHCHKVTKIASLEHPIKRLFSLSSALE